MKPVTVNRESGNVLFLILIAVALFAALSYAVTQSTRSGGGSTEREQSLLGSASLTQYPTSLRTAVIRMILAGNDVRNLFFNAPGDFTVSTSVEVFHPDGGGAVHQQTPSDVMATASPGSWVHNANFYIDQIGRDTGSAGNDLIAFMPGVNLATCQRINFQMGLPSSGSGCGAYVDEIPQFDATNADLLENMDEAYTFPNALGEQIVCGTAFYGMSTGCFYDPNLLVNGITGNNVFYSVILER